MSWQNEPLAPGFAQEWVTSLLTTLAEQADALGELDRRAGDGDFGTNLSTALRLAETNVAETRPETYAQWLSALSRGFLGVGGTSGPLFGMLFRDFSRASEGASPTPAEFGAGVQAGLATVQHYGEAEPGHKTMVDALAPAAEASTDTDVESPSDYLDQIARAAVDGALATRDIVARRGRASYVGEAAKGVIDPGAATVAISLQLAAAVAGGRPADLSWLDR